MSFSFWGATMTTLCALSILASLLILLGIWWPESPRCRLSFDVPTLPVDPSSSAPAPLSQAIESAPQDVEPRGCAALYQYPMGDATEPFPHENAGTPFFTF